jgi:hypothetical protein
MAKAEKSRTEKIVPRLLDYQSAACFLGLSVQTLRNWVSAGKYPEIRPKRLGGKPLFDRLTLEKFCDSLTTGEGRQ